MALPYGMDEPSNGLTARARAVDRCRLRLGRTNSFAPPSGPADDGHR